MILFWQVLWKIFSADRNMGFPSTALRLMQYALPNIFQPSYLNSDASPFKNKSIWVGDYSREQPVLPGEGESMFLAISYYRFNSSIPSQLEACRRVPHSEHRLRRRGLQAEFGISALGGFKINKQTALDILIR